MKLNKSVRSSLKDSLFVPYFLLFMLYLGMHLLCTANYNDDLVFSQISVSDILGRLQWNYHNWSTRLVIEFVYYHLYHLPIAVWYVLDSAVMVLMAYSIMRLFAGTKDQRAAYISCVLVLLYPMIHMANTGWISTSANYTWPMALGLYGMTYLRRVYDGTRIRWWQYLLYIPAFIYAGNAEQTVCLLLVFYILTAAYLTVSKKRFRFSYILHLAILIFMFIFKVTGPSNEIVNRTISGSYYPDYYNLNTLVHISEAFIATMSHFIRYANLVFLLLLGLLTVQVWIRHKEKMYRAIPAVPFLSCLGIALFSSASSSQLYGFTLFEDGFITIDNFSNPAEYVPLAFYILTVCFILISIYLIWGATMKTVLGELIFLGGIATRMIMSFSPSLYASSTRTFCAMYFCLIALVFLLIQDLNQMETAAPEQASLKKLNSGIRCVIFAGAVWSFFSTLITL